MGAHAGNRGNNRGFRASEETWETFLTHLSQMSAIDVSKLDGMPSAPAFVKKRQRDNEFDRRAVEIMAARSLQKNSGRPVISNAQWDRFFKLLPETSITRIVTLDGMPSMAAVYKWRRQNSAFASRLADVIHDMRRVRERRIASGLRMAALWHDPAFVEKTLAAIADWRAKQPRRIPIKIGDRPLKLRVKRVKLRVKRAKSRKIRARIAPRFRLAPEAALNAALLKDTLYAAASAAVPKRFDPDVRNDIIAEMVLAVLEKEIEISDLAAKAPEFTTRYMRMYGRKHEVSMNSASTDGTRSEDEIASSIAARDWHHGHLPGDEPLRYQPPTQVEDTFHGQVRRATIALQESALVSGDMRDMLSFDEVYDLMESST